MSNILQHIKQRLAQKNLRQQITRSKTLTPILDAISEAAKLEGIPADEIVADYVGGKEHPIISAALGKTATGGLYRKGSMFDPATRPQAKPAPAPAKPAPKPAATIARPAPKATASAPAPSSRAQLVTKHAELVKERQRLGLCSHGGAELSDRESRLLRTLQQLPRGAPPAERNPAASEDADSRVYQRFENHMNSILPEIQQLSKQP